MSSVAWLGQRRKAAVEEISQALQDQTEYTELQAEQHKYPPDTVVWKTTLLAKEEDWELHVLLPSDFPDEPPKARVLSATELFLTNPHVDRNGYVCVIPDSTSIDSSDPVELFRYAVNSVKEILEGTASADFQNEFTSYWNRALDEESVECIVIDSPDELPQAFDVVIRDKLICAAASSESLNSWLANYLGEREVRVKAAPKGILLWLDAPLLPKEYPSTLYDLVELAHLKDPKGAYEQLTKHLLYGSDPGLILLAQNAECGCALAAVRYLAPRLSENTSFSHGFRKGKAPRKLVLSRAKEKLKECHIDRCPVKRVDHAWVHTRSGDGGNYQQCTVLCIGCGSLGGYVAHSLSRAGVGNLLLLDNDKLEWANLGRHVLGAEHIHQWKAEALGSMLTKQMPHLNIKAIPKDWRDALRKNEELFSGIDLVIATTGDWRCEGPLNHLSRTEELPPILYGWLEPYAVAGHCLVSMPASGCLACGMNRFGQFQHKVASFQDRTLKREPGGCTHYQQYGPTALLPVASMTSSTALQCLHTSFEDSILKTWVSDQTHFCSVDADLTEKWKARVESEGFEKIYSCDWRSRRECSVCH